VRVAEVVRLRDSLGSIDASLKARDGEDERGSALDAEEAAGGAAGGEGSEAGTRVEAPAEQQSAPHPPMLAATQAAEILRGRSDDVISPWLDDLLAALAAVDRGVPVERAVSEAPLVAFELEPREVVAYRRWLAGGGAIGRERFLLSAAAVRSALERAEREGGPGEMSAPAPAMRERLLDLADRYLRELAHYVEMAGRESPREAEALLRCRMRFMRAFSGLWLRERRSRESRGARQSSSA